MFTTYGGALDARDALVAAGIDRSRIEILDRTATEDDTSFKYERNEEGFWTALKHLFVPEEEGHLYAEGLHRGHAIVVVRCAPGEQDRVISLLEARNPVDVEAQGTEWRTGGWSGSYAGAGTFAGAGTTTPAPLPTATSPSPTTMAASGAREEVIPVYEEQLRVGKREVGRGSVRVHSYVVETPVQEQVQLREERVEVERRPVDRPATVSDVGADAFRERTIEVTATAEEAVIAKEARVKEEIVVRKDEEERTETVSDTVRRTEVEVEDNRTSASPPAAPRRP
ncbi:MAG: YsnF/AvaK domain-containing protein [Alphaproteobacteria bacterium]|nr:YsnF/AvaK domain-containing protein [Alphaproteobacteria bacterium]